MIRGALAIVLLGCAAGACQTVDNKKPSAAVPPLPVPVSSKDSKKTAESKPKVSKAKSKSKSKDAKAVTLPASIQAPKLPAKLEPETEAEKKLDGNLLQIVRAGRGGAVADANAKAKSLNLLDSTNLLKVEITAVDKEKVDALKKAVEAEKGNIIVGLENHVFAMVPASSIEELAKLAEVFSMATVSDTLRQ
jgi:hypothetical protein